MSPEAEAGPLVLVPLRSGSREDQGAGTPVPLQTVNQAYVSALQSAGAVPIGVPLGFASLDSLTFATGLVLPGGADVAPSRYGSSAHPTSDWDQRLDELEFPLVHWALTRGMPILGICRGLQVLNVALGGSLVQDLPSERASSVQHPSPGARDLLTHDLHIEEGSLLASALGTTTMRVNSLHHQGIDRLAPGLRASALAPDGLIEGLEAADGSWVLAVQFHPEELYREHPTAQHLFQSFVAECRRHARSPVTAPA